MTKDYEMRGTSESKNEESSSSFFLGVLIGGLAGAAAAILLAPKSGREIRSTINYQAGSIKEKTVQLINKTKPFDEQEEEVNYIPIGAKVSKKREDSVDELEIRKKLEEAKKAFEEEEHKVTH
jgi:gas vesicle protein